ncbi:MAG: hypothetical protein L0Y54_21725 [Sporichthyaceae bacterium]|nr:hypothetical protein [Sporichthyaceae bacterium]
MIPIQSLGRIRQRVRAAARWTALWLLVPLPSAIKVPLYRLLFGYRIGRDVRIGLVLIRVGRLTIGDHARIGSFTIFKDIPEVAIGSCCLIGRSNHFTTAAEFSCERSRRERGNAPCLVIGDHCGISVGHRFDVQDRFEIGAFTTVAGQSSTFFTHQLDIASGKQTTKPILIGPYCMLGSDVRLGPGARIGPCSVVGMGAVVHKAFSDPYALIVGNPATVARRLDPDSAYFRRASGFIASYTGPPYRGARSA